VVGNTKKELEKEWRRAPDGWWYGGVTLAEDGADVSVAVAVAATAAPLLSAGWSWSRAPLAFVEGALLGLGVARLRLLLEGVLRGPRGLPLGQP
jgi:hypothetical protein